MNANEGHGIDDALDRFEDVIERDRYDLAHAAFHLAHIVSDMTRSGEVIAINARWGGGKTSLVSLTEAFFFDGNDPRAAGNNLVALRRCRPMRYPDATFYADVENFRQARVSFVRFNAWLESGEQGIALGIIDTIIDSLHDPDKAKTIGRRLFRHFRRNPGQYLKAGVALFNFGLSWFSSNKAEGVPDLQKIENLEKEVDKLVDQINEKNVRLVVVIDDVDRMPPERIQALITALWWVRELPKVNFLLLYDRDQVIDSLARTMFRATSDTQNQGKSSAARFLEKIVQYSFDVPQPTRERMLAVLEEELRRFAGPIDGPSFELFDSIPRWTAIRNRVLRNLVNTPRAVNRLVGVVKTSWPMRKHIELDFRDLVAIEAIRLFRPALFGRIETIAAKLEVADALLVADPADDAETNTILAVLMPAHFRKEGEKTFESAAEVRERRGFGAPELMSHYLQGVPQPKISVSYDLEDFFNEKDKAFDETLLWAVKEKKLRQLSIAIVAEIHSRSAVSARTHRHLADRMRAVSSTLSESDPNESAWAAQLKEQAGLVDD